MLSDEIWPGYSGGGGGGDGRAPLRSSQRGGAVCTNSMVLERHPPLKIVSLLFTVSLVNNELTMLWESWLSETIQLRQAVAAAATAAPPSASASVAEQFGRGKVKPGRAAEQEHAIEQVSSLNASHMTSKYPNPLPNANT